MDLDSQESRSQLTVAHLAFLNYRSELALLWYSTSRIQSCSFLSIHSVLKSISISDQTQTYHPDLFSFQNWIILFLALAVLLLVIFLLPAFSALLAPSASRIHHLHSSQQDEPECKLDVVLHNMSQLCLKPRCSPPFVWRESVVGFNVPILEEGLQN